MVLKRLAKIQGKKLKEKKEIREINKSIKKIKQKVILTTTCETFMSIMFCIKQLSLMFEFSQDTKPNTYGKYLTNLLKIEQGPK